MIQKNISSPVCFLTFYPISTITATKNRKIQKVVCFHVQEELRTSINGRKGPENFPNVGGKEEILRTRKKIGK
jgi:hypothetical protein